MITAKQRKLIRAYANDWISQFPESSVESIKYVKTKLTEGRPYTHSKVKLLFNVLSTKRGGAMLVEITVLDKEAVDWVIIGLMEQEEVYKNIEAHANIGFNVMSEEKSDKWVNGYFSL